MIICFLSCDTESHARKQLRPKAAYGGVCDDLYFRSTNACATTSVTQLLEVCFCTGACAEYDQEHVHWHKDGLCSDATNDAAFCECSYAGTHVSMQFCPHDVNAV